MFPDISLTLPSLTYSRRCSLLVRLALCTLLAIAVPACGSSDDGPEVPTTPGTPDDGGEVTPPAVQPASTKARVVRKEPRLLANDLARGLEVSVASLCQELGSYDCFETHNVLLGGVEPYTLRIDEPLAGASVAAPMAIDRIVLSACGERTQRDFADPQNAVLFTELANAANPGVSEREAVSRRIFERLLARPARTEEAQALAGLFYDDAVAGEPMADAREWSQLACYAVATSTEFLFF